MKLFVYGFREEERIYFDRYCEQYHISYAWSYERPNVENASLSKGYSCISILSTDIDTTLIGEFSKNGVQFISTRTIGFEHIDEKAAQAYHIRYGNVQYGAETVANYTVMLMMMALRNVKLIMQHAQVQNYSFSGLLGTNLHGKTIGIVGCGAIAQMLIQNLLGFHCKILVYSRSVKAIPNVQFVTLDEIYRQSDVLSLHIPLNKETYHILGKNEFSKMKSGVVIINTARGGLIDSSALIQAIEKHIVGAAALDVIEGEGGIYYNDCKAKIIPHHNMAILNAFPNVLLMPHMAWLSEEAVGEMVKCSIKSCYAFMKNEDNPWEICA